MAWSSGTDIDLTRQGHLLFLALGGLAKEIVRDIPHDEVTHGRHIDHNDGNGPVPTPGIHVILWLLTQRFDELSVETTIRSIIDFVSFRRRPGEAIDMALSRFELLRRRAMNVSELDMGPVGNSWMLLNALGIAPQHWNQYLLPFRGTLPTTAQAFHDLTSRLRRAGHLTEPRGLASVGSRSNQQQALTYMGMDQVGRNYDPSDVGNPGSIMEGTIDFSSVS